MSTTKTTFWKDGDKTKLAKAAGISRQYLSNIIHGRKSVSVKQAGKLREASVVALGMDRAIPVSAWVRIIPHPAFEE